MSSLEGIHILGVGNLGRLFAHALAVQPNPPPITLLLHRESLLQEWERAGKKIEITTDGVPNSTGSFEVEAIGSEGHAIQNLITTTKAMHTSNALSSIAHRLTASSTILFTQNGMGVPEEVTSSVFPETSKRPQYLAAITSHGVFSQGPFRSVHAGKAFVTISQMLHDNDVASHTQSTQGASSYLLNQIVNAPVLSATKVPPIELKFLQLEKLVVNAMINPLTAIFHCKNGELFNKEPILTLMRLLLAEASEVLSSLSEVNNNSVASTSEIESGTEVSKRFSPEILEEIVLSVAQKTARNTSSMLQDVEAGRETEIDYINGWIVRKGEEREIECRKNRILVDMVRRSLRIGVDDIERYFPS